jgi:hypothetical protein
LRTTAKHTDHPVRVGPDDMSALAFALNESFDVLDLLYLEQDGVSKRPVILSITHKLNSNHDAELDVG